MTGQDSVIYGINYLIKIISEKPFWDAQSVFLTLISIIFSGAITWAFSYWFFKRSNAELSKQLFGLQQINNERKRSITRILDSLDNSRTAIERKRDVMMAEIDKIQLNRDQKPYEIVNREIGSISGVLETMGSILGPLKSYVNEADIINTTTDKNAG